MNKGFSILNVIILLSLFFLSFLTYNKYLTKNLEPNSPSGQQKEESQIISDLNMKASTSLNNISPIIKKTNPFPDPKTLPAKTPKTSETKINPEQIPLAHNGFYLNKIYGYSIYFPASWNLKDQYPENIIIGTIPPKNGQGSLNIKISNDAASEIKLLENEVKKFPGILKLNKEKIIISNVEGEKLTLINNAAKLTTIYITLNFNKNNYILQYSVTSDEFSEEINEILKKFKFMTN